MHTQVGPYANPQESYDYYSLPYCAPRTRQHPENEDSKFNEYAWQSIGEYLSGRARRHSGYDLVFAEDKTEVCTTEPLTEEQAKQFEDAIWHRWMYEMHVDDLPLWGMVGESLPDKKEDVGLVPHVYTYRHLIFKYNGNQIVQVDLTSDPDALQQVKPGVTLKFHLNIHWEKTTNEFYCTYDSIATKTTNSSVTKSIVLKCLAASWFSSSL